MDRNETERAVLRLDKFSRILAVTLCVFLTVLFVWGCLIPTDSMRLNFVGVSQPIDFSAGWKEVGTGKAVDGSPQLRSGETLVIERALPSYIPAGYSLFYQVNNLYTRVSINGRELFVSGQNSSANFGRESGNIWSMFSLTSDYAGKTIRFTFTNNGIGNAAVTRVLIGSESALAFYLLRSTAPLMLVCFVSLLLGILLLFYYRLLKSRDVPFAYQQFLFLGLFIIDASVWCLSDSNVLQFISGNSSLRYLLSYFTFLLMPVPMLLFCWQLIDDYRSSYIFVFRAYLLSTFVILALYAADVIHISRTIYIVHIYIVLIIVQTVYCLIAEIAAHHKKKYAGVLFAFSIMGAAAAIGLYLYYNRSTNTSYDNSASLRIGILTFCLIMLFTSVRGSLRELKDIVFAQRYKELAYRDEVTGGSTIQKFRDTAAAAQDWKKGGYAILLINLQRFKLVNETIGREAANAELRRIYDALDSETGEDELLCRFTAEFILLVKAPNEDVLFARYRHFINATESEGVSAVNLFDISSCACFVEDGEADVELLIDRARMAYKNAHAIHRVDGDLWIYTDGCRDQLFLERQMESESRSALKNGEFVVYLQPKVAPRSGALTGAEALVRWQRSDGTLIPPAEFIPLFEKNGFITELDLYMFEQVCLLLKRWNDEGRKVPLVSVNISKVAINRNDLFARYEEIIERIKPPLARLELEFTESMAYRDAELMCSIIDRIHSYGASCSIDDFGSAYSNLNTLVRFDFDTVKLDKCFFDYGFPADRKSYEVVSGVISMLKTIGMDITAEGIETEEQVGAVSGLGCDSIQGFYYSKPIPCAEFYEKYICRSAAT